MKNPQCKMCQAGAGLEEGLSQRKVAEKYGINKASVARHRKHYTETTVDSFLEQHGIAPETVTSRAISVPQDDGTWQKVSWQPNKAEERRVLAYEDLAHLFDEPVVVPPSFASNDHTEVLNMTDLQIGKAMQRGGGTPETLARARESIAKFVRRVRDTRPANVLLADGGDPIENIWNVGSQRATNDMTPDEQERVARRLFAEAIRAVAPYAPRVIFLTVPSNHGQVKTDYKTPLGTTDADYGLAINYALEEVFEDRHEFSHVEFVRPDALEETAVVDVSGTRIAFNHGHHTKGPLKQPEWWAKQDHGRRPGWDADIFVFGHYHTFNVGHSGDGRWIISASSSDPGSDWFTNSTGEAARQGMTAFTVQDGQWSDLAIL